MASGPGVPWWSLILRNSHSRRVRTAVAAAGFGHRTWLMTKTLSGRLGIAGVGNCSAKLPGATEGDSTRRRRTCVLMFCGIMGSFGSLPVRLVCAIHSEAALASLGLNKLLLGKKPSSAECGGEGAVRERTERLVRLKRICLETIHTPVSHGSRHTGR